MFEFDKYQSTLHQDRPAAPSARYDPVTEVTGMSFLHWAEHCVECAAPACYSSCDLYQPRSDLRCRRFTYGAYRNKAFPSIRGYGVEISFKKWAKLEAFGNTAVRPLHSVLLQERALQFTAPITSITGHLLSKVTGNPKWAQLTYIAGEKFSRSQSLRRRRVRQPDAFLLEVYNPADHAMRMQIIFSVSTDDIETNGHVPPLVPSVVKGVSLPSGYSRHEFHPAAFRQILDRGLPFKITMLPEGDENARLVFLSADLVTFASKNGTAADQSKARQPNKIKCAVFDLDNTLWSGTLIEGDSVALREGVADVLRDLDRRGILLSVVSKNDFKSAWDKLTELGVAGYFLYPQIDWSPKSQQVRKIASKLNIGLDTFAFIDDNPFELDEVSSAIPELLPLPADRVATLTSDPRFLGSISEESRRRRGFYRTEMVREKEQETFGGDYLAFLKTCEIVLEISSYQASDEERATELVQRTNQLNFSGHKYSRGEFDQLIGNPQLEKYVLRCSDKYGSYGTIGFCVVGRQSGALEILDLMLSCRVQGKFIEQALLAHLLEHHCTRAIGSIWVNFSPTERNKPAENVLDALGFRRCTAAQHGRTDGMLVMLSQPIHCDFITVRCASNVSGAEHSIGAASGPVDGRATDQS